MNTLRDASGAVLLVWDAGTDAPGLVVEALALSVVTAAAPPAALPYMVVDLSAGADAASYPVSYLADAPAGGWGDEYKTTKLVLRRIPAGSFTMGSPDGEVGRDSSYEYQHTVTLTHDFWIGVFEVTQRQWELVMGTKPSYFSNASCYSTRPVECVSYNDIRGSSSGSQCPSSSAVDASSFMGRLRARASLGDGMVWDLPTEAQWRRRPIRRGLRPGRSACFGAAAGATTRSTAVPPTASTTPTRRAGTTTLASAPPGSCLRTRQAARQRLKTAKPSRREAAAAARRDRAKAVREENETCRCE